MTRFEKTLATLAATGLLSALGAAAFAVTPDKGVVLGTDAAAIGTALAQDGYELTRYNRAPALIQVTAMKDSRKHLILISARDGAVISHKSGAAVSLSDTSYHDSATPVQAPEGLAEKLAEQGYALRHVKIEGYELEAYATRDGRMWELKLDPASGTILRVEAED